MVSCLGYRSNGRQVTASPPLGIPQTEREKQFPQEYRDLWPSVIARHNLLSDPRLLKTLRGTCNPKLRSRICSNGLPNVHARIRVAMAPI